MDSLVLGGLIFSCGLIGLAVGFARRARAGAIRSLPCVYISDLKPLKRQFITGKARSPARVTSPVSKQNCVFYYEVTEEYRRQHSSSHRSAGRGSWDRVSDNFYGAFFVDDPTGAALVLPNYGALDLAKPDVTFDDSPDRRRVERVILQGETVSALGVPRAIGELVKFLRHSGANLHPDFLAELLRLERDPAFAGLPCFFGDGLERLADQTWEEYAASTGESAAFLLQAGGAAALAGAALLLYELKKLLPVSPAD
jgi:hypothetical protein